MAHTIKHKKKLMSRVRRLKGQLEGIERALEADADCGEILRQLASARGAFAGLNAEVMEGHLFEHVVEVSNKSDRAEAGQEIVQFIRTYMK